MLSIKNLHASIEDKTILNGLDLEVDRGEAKGTYTVRMP